MKFVCVPRTHVGKVREHNEDSWLAEPELGLFAVADGMGGHAAGEVASQEAVATLLDMVISGRQVVDDFIANPGQECLLRVGQLLERAVRAAAYSVFNLSQVDPDRKGMGTTLSALLLAGGVAFVAHVGDSRIYILRGSNTRLLTRDHTFVNEMVRRGKLTVDEARRSRYANMLMRAVGPNDFVEVDLGRYRFRQGDVFCICSDGLSRYIRKSEQLLELLDPSELALSADRLIQHALDGGGRDNVTVLLVRVDP
ncbi:MAG: serine/threonine-protein phosphatase [Deltaproteobacteria bacterium]|nr:MAG: serine/threonine-protein phosphatase [Deltaproteobacteria bacterium]